MADNGLLGLYYVEHFMDERAPRGTACLGVPLSFFFFSERFFGATDALFELA